MAPEIIERAHALVTWHNEQCLALADALGQRANNIPGGVHVAGVHLTLARAAIQKATPDIHMFFSHVALAESAIAEREHAIATETATNLITAVKGTNYGRH